MARSGVQPVKAGAMPKIGLRLHHGVFIGLQGCSSLVVLESTKNSLEVGDSVTWKDNSFSPAQLGHERVETVLFKPLFILIYSIYAEGTDV